MRGRIHERVEDDTRVAALTRILGRPETAEIGTIDGVLR